MFGCDSFKSSPKRHLKVINSTKARQNLKHHRRKSTNSVFYLHPNVQKKIRILECFN